MPENVLQPSQPQSDIWPFLHASCDNAVHPQQTASAGGFPHYDLLGSSTYSHTPFGYASLESNLGYVPEALPTEQTQQNLGPVLDLDRSLVGNTNGLLIDAGSRFLNPMESAQLLLSAEDTFVIPGGLESSSTSATLSDMANSPLTDVQIHAGADAQLS